MKNIATTQNGFTEWCFLVLLANVWGLSMFGYIIGFAKGLPFLGQFAETIPYFAIVVPLLFSLKYISNKLSIIDYCFYMTVLFIYIIEFALYPYNSEIQKHAYSFLVIVLPCFFIGRLINIKDVDELLYLVSLIGVVLTSAYYLIYAQFNTKIETEHYNMDGAYDLLRFSLYVISYAIRKKTILSILVSLMSVVMILSFGTRGPLLCVIVFVAFFVLIFGKFKYAKIIKTSTVILFGFLYLYIDEFMLFLQRSLQSLHMSTRIVDNYFRDELDVSEARVDFIDELLQVMNSGSFPLFGEGLCGSYKYIGIYPHNLLIELLFSFGYVCGGIIFVLIIVLFIRAMIISNDITEKSFLLLLFCSSILKLMMSGSFLDESTFFMLIGYSLVVIRNQKSYV